MNSPFNQKFSEKSPLNQFQPKLPKKIEDSLQRRAFDMKEKRFYSKKYGVYVEAEDGVLFNTPPDASGYKRI